MFFRLHLFSFMRAEIPVPADGVPNELLAKCQVKQTDFSQPKSFSLTVVYASTCCRGGTWGYLFVQSAGRLGGLVVKLGNRMMGRGFNCRRTIFFSHIPRNPIIFASMQYSTRTSMRERGGRTLLVIILRHNCSMWTCLCEPADAPTNN